MTSILDIVEAGIAPLRDGLPLNRRFARRRRELQRQSHEQNVYFIQNSRTKNVKIGVARDVNVRLTDLQTANESRLDLLLTLPGGKALETDLHRRFAACRIRGEWFRYEWEIRRFVLQHRIDELRRR